MVSLKLPAVLSPLMTSGPEPPAMLSFPSPPAIVAAINTLALTTQRSLPAPRSTSEIAEILVNDLDAPPGIAAADFPTFTVIAAVPLLTTLIKADEVEIPVCLMAILSAPEVPVTAMLANNRRASRG